MTESDERRRAAADFAGAEFKAGPEHSNYVIGNARYAAFVSGCYWEAAHHAEELKKTGAEDIAYRILAPIGLTQTVYPDREATLERVTKLIASELASRDAEIERLNGVIRKYTLEGDEDGLEFAFVVACKADISHLETQLQSAREGLEFIKDRFEFHHKDRDGRVVVQNLLAKIEEMK